MIDHGRYERASRMASAARPAVPAAQAASTMTAGATGALRDRFGRAITYLRVSVTDRCNLRCEYCTPIASGVFLPHDHLLTDDELLEIIQAMARAGLEKVRFTGGEPLVRPGFQDLVARVQAEVPAVRELCVSTNGLLLAEQAAALVERGITRFNVSLDTRDPARFREVTRGGDLARVRRGVDAVLAARERDPRIRVKLNAVLMRGVNDGEIEDFARLTLESPIHVRFIELMPLEPCGGGLYDERFLSATAVLAALERMGGAEPVERSRTDGPALLYRLAGAPGTVGVISPVSETHFCDRCNRVRLGADGRLKLCLFGDEYADLRAVLRARPRSEGDLERALLAAMDLKPEKMAGYSGFSMMSIGG